MYRLKRFKGKLAEFTKSFRLFFILPFYLVVLNIDVDIHKSLLHL